MRTDWPELSDLLIDIDPKSLERRPVGREAVRRVLRRHGMRKAEQILDGIPGGDLLDPCVVDGILVRSHCELQRLAYEFRNGRRLLQLLGPLLEVLRSTVTERPIRVVDVGCGLGFVVRWLSAYGALGDDVELLGCDLNPVLVGHAARLAREEGLRCSFRVANAFTLERHAHVFVSTGVLHHFRGEGLVEFFRSQSATGAAAVLHCDIKASWAAPLGSWIFHQARMREPLAQHDGVLSAVRAHPRDELLAAACAGGRPLHFGLFDGRPSPLPILRTLSTLVGMRAEIVTAFRARLGAAASRLEPLA